MRGVWALRHLLILPAVMISLGLVLSGCSKTSKHAALDPFAGTGSDYYKGSGPLPKGGGRYFVGKPYQVAGRWFTPKEQPNYDKEGPASWYGEAFNRRRTSNGEWFDMNDLTAAHPTLPLPSYVKVTNLDNGRELIVRVNDRGPFVGTRIIDLSKRSADVLGFKRKGGANVRVQYAGPAPLNDKGRHLAAMNAELERGTPLRRLIAAAKSGHGDVLVADAKPRKAAKPAVIAESVSTKAATVAEAYFVQVGAFADLENAERARASFANSWPVQMVELEGQGGTIYRVRVGPINGAADAETALDAAVALGHPDAHVIVAPTMHAAL